MERKHAQHNKKQGPHSLFLQTGNLPSSSCVSIRIFNLTSHFVLPKWTEIWWEAPMEGSVLSFLKAEWKVSDTDSAHWASSFFYSNGKYFIIKYLP
jgi:hypothetical protein